MIVKPVTDVILIAGETLEINDLVFFADARTPFLYGNYATAKIYKTDRSIRAKSVNADILGFVIQGGAADEKVVIRTAGTIGGLSGLIGGTFLQPAMTAGEIEEFNRAVYEGVPIAFAFDENSLEILPRDYEQKGRGYTLGTYDGSNRSYIRRFSFATNTSATAIAVLTVGFGYTAAASSQTRGYALGYNGAATINAMSFANEAVSALSNLTGNMSIGAACSSLAKGYVAPRTSGTTPNVDSINFSDDTVADPGCDLTTDRNRIAAASGILKGYWFGGYLVATSLSVNTIDALTFSNETMAALASTLTGINHGPQATPSGTKIYVGAGYTTTGPAFKKTVDVLTLSNETIAAGTDLTQARYAPAAFSSTLAAFWLAGQMTGPAYTKTCDIVPFSTETPSDCGDWVGNSMATQGCSC